MTDTDLAGQRFRVFDVISSLYPADRGGLGVVIAVRRYEDGHYTYLIAPLDPDDERVGGYYGDDQLLATGRRKESVTQFWSGPLRAREIVIVTDDHPRAAWRGLYGVIVGMNSDEAYEVEFMIGRGWNRTPRWRTLQARHLRSSGRRLAPEPVPRPIRTYHPGRDEQNVFPANDFYVIDELEQYL